MRRAVIQAYVGDIPWWVQKCINSVKAWCAKNDVDYVWYDSAFNTIESRLGLKNVDHLFYQKWEWIDATKGYDSLMWVDTDILVQGNPQFDWQSEFTVEYRRKVMVDHSLSWPQGGLFFGTRVLEMAQWFIKQSYLPWQERHDTVNYLISVWNYKQQHQPLSCIHMGNDQSLMGVWIEENGYTDIDRKKYIMWNRRPFDCDDDCFIHFIGGESYYGERQPKEVIFQQYLMLRMWQKKERLGIAFNKK